MVKAPFRATVLGTARIGRNRELKKAVEAFWAGRASSDELAEMAAVLRRETIQTLVAAGLDSVPVNCFSYYDQMLDTAQLVGAIPTRYRQASKLDTYFAAARGAADLAPMEMTKWFDTNYHYLVPELDSDTTFTLDSSKLLLELDEAVELGAAARPVVIGPLTFVLLAKTRGNPLDYLDALVPVYVDLLNELADHGVEWVQFDEPALVQDRTPDEISAYRRVYQQIASSRRPALLVATYFGSPDPVLWELPVDGVAVDVVRGEIPEELVTDKMVAVGIVDGRNVWRTNLSRALTYLNGLPIRNLAVSTSCSLLHVPYSLAGEKLDPSVSQWLAFGDDKLCEVTALASALSEGRSAAFDASDEAFVSRLNDPRTRPRLDAAESISHRPEFAVRQRIQDETLSLPVLPTTTIGSFPQHREIRINRQKFSRGEIDAATYTSAMRKEIDDVIALQEKLGLDVLVHGEPERNDMVQYFAEQLDGIVTTVNGWVQSYGSRCVRPPIIFGEVKRPRPMTVDWFSYAQSRTSKPVKGMLTGPVTILAWSFVRDDQPRSVTATQLADAISDEVVDLERAGARIIQVDEPALRELLPLKQADHERYLTWAVEAFRRATSRVADSTQIHTHLCYSEFGDVITAIADLDADVTSIEAARSKMEILGDLDRVGFSLGVGPGVYDIHSPRVPSREEIVELLRLALDVVSPKRLWVNPDCGLKTRGAAEVEESLRNLVEATAQIRSELQVPA